MNLVCTTSFVTEPSTLEEAETWIITNDQIIKKATQMIIFLNNVNVSTLLDHLKFTSKLQGARTYILHEKLAVDVDYQLKTSIVYKLKVNEIKRLEIEKKSQHNLLGTSFPYTPFTYYSKSGQLDGFEVHTVMAS